MIALHTAIAILVIVLLIIKVKVDPIISLIVGCLYLFISLPVKTQQFFVAAQIIGLILYMIYGSRAAEKARGSAA